MQCLVAHPAVAWDASTTFASMHGKKLKARHLPLFDRTGAADPSEGTECHDPLFDMFAQAVCHAGCVARKEVFETWAAALRVHAAFFRDDPSDAPSLRRVADVAAGHGLLAWALLLLDDEHRGLLHPDDDGPSAPPLTALAVDVHMPRSAEAIRASMLHRWPHLNSRFDYVEGRLEQLVPHPSCLLASVHACGILSDMLAAAAAAHAVPVAVVPCCHSRKPKVLEVASPLAREWYEDIIFSGEGAMPDLADRLDEARMAALRNGGLDVREEFLPHLFTGKNRLILGVPGVGATEEPQTAKGQGARTMAPARKGRMPPLADVSSGILPKSSYLKGFAIPCEDAEAHRRIASTLAGRAAADNRKATMRNRHHAKSPTMDVSLWLPPEEGEVSVEALARLVEQTHDARCTVSKVGEVYVNPAGRRAQTFRIRYHCAEDEAIFRFEEAKRMHNSLYEAIPRHFPGAECR